MRAACAKSLQGSMPERSPTLVASPVMKGQPRSRTVAEGVRLERTKELYRRLKVPDEGSRSDWI